jgi:hypothetical protein
METSKSVIRIAKVVLIVVSVRAFCVTIREVMMDKLQLVDIVSVGKDQLILVMVVAAYKSISI